ncbi:MAG: glycosyltransferase [Candidatus Zixiibacteriota bacterium]|nr:MAG: glycosyltransferase [candidate division Zixibacteria bacterium]
MLPQDIADLRESLSRGEITTHDLTGLANQYLEENELERAYPVVSLLTETTEASTHTFITAGLVALALAKKEDASRFFQCVTEREADHFDANYNLILIDMEAGRTGAARQRLERLIGTYPDNASLHSDMAVLCSDDGDIEQALKCWQKALSIDPNHSLARNNAMEICLEKNLVAEGKHLLTFNAKTPGISSGSIREIQDWAERLRQIDDEKLMSPTGQGVSVDHLSGKKIAFFAGIDTFVKDIVAHLSKANLTRTFTGGTVEDARQLMEWADLAWFEWCDNFLIEATRLPKTCQIVCRLHSYEAFSDMPARVDWSKVDLLVFVNDSVKDVTLRHFTIPTRSVVIHNAVDSDRFTLPSVKTYGKKIASVGYINYKKNPALLLYCFKKIYQYDPGYSLHVAGEHQDPRIKLYFDHFLRENPLPVHFDGWVDDMPLWYADKDFVISTSLFESFHYSIAEGMACGQMPLIHNWYGASNLYPEEFLFDDPDSCLELLKRFEESDRQKLAEANRQFIIERYSLPEKLAAIEEELLKVVTTETEPDLAEVVP